LKEKDLRPFKLVKDLRNAALVLLLAGAIVAALLWLLPCEAEREASLIRVGMTREQVAAAMCLPEVNTVEPTGPTSAYYLFEDGSLFEIRFDADLLVSSVRTTPQYSTPLSPLDRLRRVLARAFPFLEE
jgi:hypothetical protein